MGTVSSAGSKRRHVVRSKVLEWRIAPDRSVTPPLVRESYKSFADIRGATKTGPTTARVQSATVAPHFLTLGSKSPATDLYSAARQEADLATVGAKVIVASSRSTSTSPTPPMSHGWRVEPAT
jgi:hypothetical protein